MMDDQMTPTGVAEENQEPIPADSQAAAENSGVAPSPEPADAAVEVKADASPEEAPEEPAPAAEAAPVEPEPVQPEPVQPEPVQSEPVAEAPAPEPVDDSSLFDDYMKSFDTDSGESGSGAISRGDRIEAEVIQVEDNRVFVNLGTKAEGVVPLEELAEQKLDTAKGHVNVGDKFEVIVLKTTAEGNPVVSKKKADFDQQWRLILEAFETGEVFRATVVDRVKGGLVVDIGVRGFVPATHVGTGKLRNIEKYVGEIIPVKIIEIDRERRKVVLSNRLAEEERRDEVKKDLFGKVKVGDILPGTVRRLTDYGAFVDLGGIDGLLHISEMSWMRIDHPKEVLKEGQEINVLVLRLDEGNGRISLGLRQVLPDPWSLVRDNYKLGQKIQVKVTRMVQSGAFVRLPEQAEAFLPLSEISDKRLKKPQDLLEINQDIEPMIIDLKPEDRRMVLSLRENATPGSYRSLDGGANYGGAGGFGGGYNGGQRGGPGGGRRPFGQGGGLGPRGRGRDREPDFDAPNVTTRTPTGGATIGERLGMLKGLIKNNEPAESNEPADDAENS